MQRADGMKLSKRRVREASLSITKFIMACNAPFLLFGASYLAASGSYLIASIFALSVAATVAILTLPSLNPARPPVAKSQKNTIEIKTEW
jgi:hypothetical protein